MNTTADHNLIKRESETDDGMRWGNEHVLRNNSTIAYQLIKYCEQVISQISELLEKDKIDKA